MFAKAGLFADKGKTLIAVFLFLVTSGTGFGALLPEAEPQPVPPPSKPLVWSLLYPGLGQLLERRPLPGLVLMAAETAAVVVALSANHRANSAFWRYRQATTRQEAATFRSQTERLDRQRNIAIACGVAVWAVNLLEMTLSRRTHRRSAPEGVILHATIHPFACGIGLSF